MRLSIYIKVIEHATYPAETVACAVVVVGVLLLRAVEMGLN